MATTVAKRDLGMHGENDHTVSHRPGSGSQPLRIDAKSEFLAAINETRTRLGLSIDAMASLAGVSVSAMSDALAGKEGRQNFAGHWLIAQGPEFEATYNRVVDERRGNSREAKRSRIAKNLGELVRRVVEDLEDISA